jgi:hypothetical protein
LSRLLIGFAKRAVLSTIISALGLALTMGIGAAQTGDFGSLEPISFKIMSVDGSQMLGHGQYRLDTTDSVPVLIGENRYLDGEYDIERDQLELHSDGRPPSLLAFEHSFYKTDGAQRAYGRADVRAGEASCADYVDGQEHAKQIAFPSDTYAGATAVLALESAMRIGGGVANFHVFDCGPAPMIVAVAAHADSDAQGWSFYPRGAVKQVDVTADLGWLGSVIGGLIPHREAWFDASKWQFVGARMQRYLASGPQVMLVREPGENFKVAQRD